MDTLIQLIIAIAVLLVVWWVAERFSPDPLITKIVQVIIFVLALMLVFTKVLPMVGVSF
jgi:Co/Zn/Cd efflux system component